MISPGDIVLFNLGRETRRPLLVTIVHPDATVSGELFFYHPDDSDSPWVLGGGSFYPPAISRRSMFVDHAARGLDQGEWLPKSEERAPTLSEKLGIRPPDPPRAGLKKDRR